MDSWREDEFGNQGGLGGLGVLQAAVDAQEGENHPPQVPPGVPEALADKPEEGPVAPEVAQAPVEAVEEVMGGAQPQSELPPIASCDPLKLQAAQDIIPGKTISPVNLTGWAPAKTKPRKQELMRAILERDSSQRCKHWPVEKCVLFLLETPPAVIAAAIGAAPDPAAAAPAAAPAAAQQSTQNREEGPTDTSSRWSKFKDVRLLHAIAENRAQFVARDRKLTRAELDAGARHACWESVCKTFNSQQEFAILASQEAMLTSMHPLAFGACPPVRP